MMINRISPRFSNNPLNTITSFQETGNFLLNNNQDFADVYNIGVRGLQNYLPVGERHPLSQAEHDDIKKGLSRWWPELYSSYSTPAVKLLADPVKSALIISAVLGLLTASATTVKNIKLAPFAGIMAGIFVFPLSFFHRRQENGNLLDLIQRLPAKPTKRDILSDPAYQAHLNRRAMSKQRIPMKNIADTLLTFISQN